MRNVKLCSLMLVLATGIAVAQTPSVFTGGIVSAASLAPAGSPLAAVAPGAIVSIFGSNLSPSTAAATTIPLPTLLNTTSVTIGGKAAALYFVSTGQINAQVPVDVAAGSQNVVVTRGTLQSTATAVTIASRAPAIFTAAQNGHGPGAIQNYVSSGNTPANGFNVSIAPGGLIIVYGTGGGALTAQPATGAACVSGQFSPAATATIGGATANVEFSGCSPGLVGLDQYNVRIPTTVPAGCYLPLQLTVGGVVSNMVTLAVASGGNCNTGSTTGSQAGLPNQSIGSLSLARNNTSISVPGFGTINTAVTAFAGVFEKFGFSGQTSGYLPPAGAGCLIEVGKLSSSGGTPADTTVTLLDAGTLTLTTPGGAGGPFTITRDPNSGTYGVAGNPTGGGLTLVAGSYSVRGSGGANVGAFGPVNLTIPTLFNVTDAGYTGGAISQSASFTPKWTCPDPAGEVYAYIYSQNTTTGLYGSAYCTAACSDGKITIPSSVLKQLPVSSASAFISALIYIPGVKSYPQFTASGIDFGIFLYTDSTINSGTLNP